LKTVQEENKYPRLSASKEKNLRESAFANEMSKSWQKLDPAYRYTFIAGIILLAVVFVYYADIGPFRASQLTIKSLQTYPSNFYEGYSIFKKALSTHSPYLKETRDEFSKMILMLGNSKTGLTKDELKVYFNEATNELEKTKKEHPKDVYVHMYLSQWYFSMAALFDPVYMQNAEEEANAALNLSPRRQQVYYNAARLYMVGGDYDSAEKFLLKIRGINPNVGDTYWYLGVLYALTDQKDRAYDNIAQAFNLKNSITVNSYDMRSTIDIVAEKATSTKVLDWYLAQSGGGPALYAQNYLELAKAYKRLGDPEKMRLSLSYATTTDPSLAKEAEEILK
jgi:tetratricopeptide (TPR) repeat protein